MAFHIVMVLLALLSAVTKTEPGPRYDPNTVVDLMVVVTEVRAASQENGLDGVRLLVRTEADANLEVYLGPARFLKDFDITFAKGDRLQIIGSKIKVAGNFIVLAREVHKDSSTLYLRGHSGEPYW